MSDVEIPVPVFRVFFYWWFSEKKLLDKMGKCWDFVSELILLFFRKNFKCHCHQDTKKVTTILMHQRKSQVWGKNKKMKKMNFAQNSFFLFLFQACKARKNKKYSTNNKYSKICWASSFKLRIHPQEKTNQGLNCFFGLKLLWKSAFTQNKDPLVHVQK